METEPACGVGQCVVLTVDQFEADTTVLTGVHTLLAATYENPDAALLYALEREATHVYLERDVRAAVHSAFFARMPTYVAELSMHVAYMGLTITDALTDRRGSARRLWQRYLMEARAALGEYEALAWYRTATPFGLYPAQVLLRDGTPMSDATFSAPMADAIAMLKKREGVRVACSTDHPFVVRGYATARYREAERARIAAYRKRRGRDVLERLAVNEQAGDRLLLLGWVP